MGEFIGWAIVLTACAFAGSMHWLAFAVGAFAIGTLWFWLALVAVSVSVIACVDNEDGVGATGSLAAFFILLHLFGNVHPVTFVVAHPAQVALSLLGYFLAGTAWSVAKWWFYCQEQRAEYDEKVKAQRQVRFALPSKPSAARSKDTILRWMSFWPWSMVWTLVNDPIKKAFRWIYRQIQAVLQRIADRAWEGVKDGQSSAE